MKLSETATLEDRATEINRLFDRSDRAEDAVTKRRWEAGCELIKAKALVRHGEWVAWCKANINRGIRDIQKCMYMAGSEDPMGELEAEKAANRTARGERSNTPSTAHLTNDKSIPPLEAAHFASWLAERAKPHELPMIISWLEGCKSRDVIAALRSQPAPAANVVSLPLRRA
jgi:hypothetical protein